MQSIVFLDRELPWLGMSQFPSPRTRMGFASSFRRQMLERFHASCYWYENPTGFANSLWTGRPVCNSEGEIRSWALAAKEITQ
jgi:hypothetical protein